MCCILVCSSYNGTSVLHKVAQVLMLKPLSITVLLQKFLIFFGCQLTAVFVKVFAVFNTLSFNFCKINLYIMRVN